MAAAPSVVLRACMAVAPEFLRPTRNVPGRGLTVALAVVGLFGFMGCGEPPSPTPEPPAEATSSPSPASVTVTPLEPASPADPPKVESPWIDLTSIIGRDQGAVDGALGAPTGCESVSPSRVGKSPKCSYRDGNVEVVFIKGKADWITVYGTDSRAPASALEVSFDAASLAQLGLSGSPTATSPIGVFWKGSVQGAREVTMFGQKGGKVSYFYVKAFTD